MSVNVKEVPITVNGRTFRTFEAFRDYLLKPRCSKERTIAKLAEEVKRFEDRFGMTSEEMAPKFKRGEFEELDHEYCIWFAHYQSLRDLREEIQHV